ncbi:hypothetical protein ABW21_db0206613 [Orbilia brochopaga]|nr:hypothetical protein ABW21_db0206613 [Drechslerella brochopaga]
MKARKKEEKRRERKQRKQEDGDESPKKPPRSDDKDKDRRQAEQNDEAVQVSPSKEQQHHPAKRKDVVKVNGDRIQVNGTNKTGKAVLHKPQPKPQPVILKADGSDHEGESDEADDQDSSSSEDEEMDDAGSDDGEDSDAAAEEEEEEDSSDDRSEGNANESIQRIEGLTATIVDSNTSPAPSNTTDASSTAQKSLAEKLKTSKDPAVQQQLKERLAKRIEELRQARKGEAPRTRTELMEQRRKRDELRKERKKQIRLQAKAEAAKAQATSNGDSVDGTPSAARKSSKAVAPANYTFGQVNFDDGEKLTASLDGTKSSKKKRGPMDVLGALKHAEAKKARLQNMPDEKRADIQEKDRWSKALKMAAGEKLQDDEGLLKKSLKRQDKAKKKSKREWNERNAGVEKAKAMRQKKRETNIAARKEQKKAGKSGKKARKVPSKKAKGRAGFEGTGFGGAGKKKKAKA